MEPENKRQKTNEISEIEEVDSENVDTNNEKTNIKAQTIINIRFTCYQLYSPDYPCEFLETAGSRTFKFSSVSMYLVARKALLFKDLHDNNMTVFNDVFKNENHKNLQQLDKKIKNVNFIRLTEAWVYKIFRFANYFKFHQNSELAKYLLGTGDNIIQYVNRIDFLPEFFQPLYAKSLMEVRDILRKLEKSAPPEPFSHQTEVLDKVQQFYEENSIGKICWCCGLGKTILSLFIVKKMGFKKILIGVPSTVILKQFVDAIYKIFSRNARILVLSGINVYGIRGVQNIDLVKLFLTNTDVSFVITTYHYAKDLLNLHFDFKICDEAHHLTGEYTETQAFKEFHKISASRTLFMTATQKFVSQKNNIIYSMDSENLFGKFIDNKPLQWGIENKFIADHRILLIKNDLKEDSTENYLINCLLLMQTTNMTHLMLYVNSSKSANNLIRILNKLIELPQFSSLKNDFYFNDFYSDKNMNSDEIDAELYKFSKKKYGIIVSIKILNEGFDYAKFDGVCFMENITTHVRIIQSVCRSNRLNREKPDKISYIILPFCDKISDSNLNILLNIHLHDDTIISKLSYYALNLHSETKKYELTSLDNQEIKRDIQKYIDSFII